MVKNYTTTLKELSKLNTVQRRVVETSLQIAAGEPEQIAYQHTVLCQTCLPYRNPGDDTRQWKQIQGFASLLIETGHVQALDGDWVPVGLPYGSKPRLILTHMNAEALRTGSPVIDVEDSLTAFVKRIGLTTDGRTIRTVKDQLTRLSASTIRLGLVLDNEHTRTLAMPIVSAFDLWFRKDERQRVLWPSTVCLSTDYFASLQKHAVPLDERAIAALSHSAMALDLYAWLAQRLHRVDRRRGQFVPWVALHQQFGQGYKHIRQFRAVFRPVIDMVRLAYPVARIVAHRDGLLLGNSPPPVQKRMVLLSTEPVR